jgi:DNA polymerase III subunit alpha
MLEFCHLHSHTQYSLLDGASDIGGLMAKAKADAQKAVAITDHGNMFGVYNFVKEAEKNGILPIIGCEFYLVENRHIKTFEKSKGQKDVRYHQLMLAKNAIGYQNLSKLCSLGFIEGLYGKYPRIDKELVQKYHEGIIVTSCCVGAEVPQAILQGDLDLAEKKLQWWLDIFGEDFYIEIQRQRGCENLDNTGISLEHINQTLLGFARKYNIKVVATNDAHYIDKSDAEAHDALLCVNTGSFIADKDRFRFPSNDYYFKTQAEMNDMFHDVPESLDNTMEIVSKIEKISLTRDVLLPVFPLPNGFETQSEYLRHLALEGARKRYPVWTTVVEDRLNFELDTITKSGYEGYFLIVQDFTTVARKMGVSVGPGRGSAAGSLIAYVLGITNIDPIKYDLLFERFLNPERVSMPDIDIDFDDEGRSKVLDYVVEKYGKNQVAQIITYGSMAAKSAIKDAGRVMNVPLNEVEAVTKSFPTHAAATLKKLLGKDDISADLKEVMQADDKSRAVEFRKLAEQEGQIGDMIRMAKKLEGSIRNTGVHACGVIITPDDLTKYVPVALAKDSDFFLSQYDNSAAESSGLLKMDFLGLRTLTIIKDALEIIRDRYGDDIDIDAISLEDPKTFELFQRGEMIGIFQYESPGMTKYLRELKPTKFEDLIAMNALYRPGPLQYIPDFIARAHGRQTITYDVEAAREYLEETYGITVYQEQVMLLSQKLAGFTKGDADKLRKAMGKKQKSELDKLFTKFLEGCIERGHPEDKVKKIWTDWEAFASYAFNKSHSTCYAYIAFQTAYLKAHYPAAFLAANLNNNLNDITRINMYLQDAKRLQIHVLGPDVNESNIKFTVNSKGDIRFGLSALKGVGEGPILELVNERKASGPFEDLFDIMRRLNLRSFNKKCMDSMALGGAFDSFGGIHRAQFVTPAGERNETFNETLLKYGNNYQIQKESNQMSLFGDAATSYIEKPAPPKLEEWGQLEKLEREKEVTGIYLSGHPLDDFALEFSNFINCALEMIDDTKGALIKCGGIITDALHGTTQKGSGYAKFTMADFTGSYQFSIYNEAYENWKHLINKGQVIYLEGVNEKGYNSDRMFLKVKDIRLLDSIGKAKTKFITLKIRLSQIDEVFVNGLTEVLTTSPGPHTVKFKLVEDDNESMPVDLVMPGTTVMADYQLVQKIEYLNIAYKIN